MIEAYKILSGIYDQRVSKGLLSLNAENRINPARNRGHTKNLYKRRARLSLRQKFFTNRIVDAWNDLPSQVVEAPSVLAFERRLDKAWKGQKMLYDFKAVLRKCRIILAGCKDSEPEQDLDL